MLRSSAIRALSALLLAVATVPLSAALPAETPVIGAAAAHAADNGLALRPYMGWSSWSQQSSSYPGLNPKGRFSYLNEANVLKQADAMAEKLKPYGYEYINMDAGWWMDWNWNPQYDIHGRQTPDKEKFPHGIKYVAEHVHARGLKLGIYLPVGLEKGAYDKGDFLIAGTTNCSTHDIVYPDLRTTNGWDSSYKIDFSKPCAQKYIDSQAQMLADWEVDFLKLDGVGPGSGKTDENHDNRADVAAMSKALINTGRPIVFETSAWPLDISGVGTWKKYANAFRPDTDVECYCSTLVTWDNSVKVRWKDIPPWIEHVSRGSWMDLDSLNVGVGAMDGINKAERQSYMTLWAIESAPLYLGDDITRLDAYGMSLLTNQEVIAQNQQGIPAKPLRQGGSQQVWYAKNTDGTYTVALFNLGSATKTVSVKWNDLGFPNASNVRDMWSRTDLGSQAAGFSVSLPAHASQLLKVTPGNLEEDRTPPSRPAGLHAIGTSASSVSLAWSPSTDNMGVTGYDVYSGTIKAASVTGSSATVTGLTADTPYTFTVVARDARGNTSPPSVAVTVRTPSTGPGGTVYEAESGTNVLFGRAWVAPCAPCSGGQKVGGLYLGGALEFRGVRAERAGTYKITVSYTAGDSTRSARISVNGGTPSNIRFSGTGGWNTPGVKTITVTLTAGNNALKFDSGPDGYTPDLDRIGVGPA
ncbi:alpha-galactosidase D [Streptomyces sp. HUAS TT20]|uniref:alpha-galactosidase D n=1 Tax=Streptomyces sp. HUAS TT20 TaxID=3447509 RepID=UPI0021D91B27|nr:fibronectin type III domain-containing protein [Streptomyces sp. HUAS 15-9]UXY32197.1 fibronectin type III domain-containing protein [Streptomyces sp. HUAS 15-9]